MGKYVIGDIHGSYTALSTIFNKLKPTGSDQFIFLGDYINRGKDSKKVIDFLLDLSKEHDCVFIRGNHEILMMTARLNKTNLDKWLAVGGNQTLKSFKVKPENEWYKKIDNCYWKFLKNTLPYFEDENFIYVHAGLEPGVPLNKQSSHALYWKMYEQPQIYTKNKTVICGHTSRSNGEIANFGHTICIDTFIHGGKWLTCLDLTTGNYIQASNRRKTYSGEIIIKSHQS